MRKNGFTIIETLVTLFVFTLIWIAIMGSIVMIYKTQGYAYQQSLAINEARKGVEVMTKEIRSARPGDNGAYPIEKAEDKQFIFYSDVDNDGKAERVRYYLAIMNSGNQSKDCFTQTTGGSCNAVFSGFLSGNLKSAQVKVSLEGDLNASGEFAEIYADGVKIGQQCPSGCTQCGGKWEGAQTYDVTDAAKDGSIQFIADGSSGVDTKCNWINSNHTLKALFEFSWTEEIPNLDNQLKKGVIKPVGSPVTYPSSQEKITMVSAYVRNSPPLFEYYDKNGAKITSNSSILKDTKMMKLYMVVNYNPQRAPEEYELESYVQLRNLKEE